MIHKIRCKKSDRDLLSETRDIINTPHNHADFDNVIVKKPWGYEYLVFQNESVAIWMLHIARKRKTSMHSHAKKNTSLVLLSGSTVCSHLDGEIKLGPLDAALIQKGAFHSTEASSTVSIQPQSEDGVWVMEIESPPSKTDLIRIKDEYGREKTSYEGEEHMVFEPAECLKLQTPAKNEVIQKSFFDFLFTVRKGCPHPDTLICMIDKGQAKTSLEIGRIMTFNELRNKVKDEDLSSCTFLTIERSKKMVKLSDYVFSFIEKLGVKCVFAVCGGGAMHLVDSLGGNKKLDYIATHHEQAAAMAAEAYARVTGKPGVALVTSGPGATNTITGVCGAWIDSIPTIFISGQVVINNLIGNTGLRQFGIQEADIVSLVKPITKYAVTVTDPNMIKYHLEKAAYLATSLRPGPVWLDIPLDVQNKIININDLVSFVPDKINSVDSLKEQVAVAIKLLKKAKRPVVISSYGIRLSKGKKEFIRLVEKLKIPVISSWTTSDLIPTGHRFYIGKSGIMGDRAGNFTVQNADLLLIIGSRMSIPQVGYNYKAFAREAKRIMVDIDIKEIEKPSIKPELAINADAREFMVEMLRQLEATKESIEAKDWLKKCCEWKGKYPIALPEYKDNKENVNSFYFIDLLSEKLDENAVVVTDMGTSFTCTMQTFKTKKGQRLFTSSGHASMGFGLPGAIGACFANNRKKTICISGDGGLQMNIQELQTLVHYNLPIILFVLNNHGYLTIKLMQQNHFGRYTGSDEKSGLSCPDIIKVAKAYGIKAERIRNHTELHARIDKALLEPGPYICEIMMSGEQPLIPRTASVKRPDGSIISKPLEDLYPFLDREEFLKNMIVKPKEVLE